MKPAHLVVVLLLAVQAGPSIGETTTLREMFERAGPQNGYDRWIELATGAVYTGGLLIGPIFYPHSNTPVGEPGQDVRIVGNGAILDLQGGQICLSYCNNRLDIDDCIIIRGGIRYRGYQNASVEWHPTGSVEHVTFWQPHDYAVRVQVDDANVSIERNLIVNPVDTGWDYLYLNGTPSTGLPTGTSISSSFGSFIARENWSFHTDSLINVDPFTHFSFLCAYG